MRSFVCLMLCIALSACSSMRWQKPEVALADVSVAGGNLFESRLLLKLRVRNRNAIDVTLDSLDFEVAIADQVLAQGKRTQPIVLVHASETIVELEANARTLELFRRVREAAKTEGRIDYTVRGNAVIHDYGSVPFSHVASLAVPKI